jgi:hypothetical protein
MATVQMIKGDLLADIFDSPETIAQARREGYSLVDPADIAKLGADLEQLTKAELLELARQKGVFQKSLAQRNKPEIIELIKAAETEGREDGEKTGGLETGGVPENPIGGTGDPSVSGQDSIGASEGSKTEGPEGGVETPADPNEKRGFFGGRK